MPNEPEKSLGTVLPRAGEKLTLTKVADRFTARLKRGVRPGKVEDSYNLEHRRRLERQGLDVFAVDAAERDAAMDRVRQGNDVEFASHVYSLANDPASRVYLTDELTVQFKPEVTDDQIEQLATSCGLELMKPLSGTPRAFVFRITSQAKENPIKISNRLLAGNRVIAAEPNIAIATKKTHVPSDSLFAEQWHLHHNGGPFLANNSHIDAVRAWDLERGQRSVVVAVADDSVDLSHGDFQGQGKIVAPRDFAGRDFEPMPELEDDNHGTSCAGVAVAEENGRGVVGVAPGCALMPIRTSGFIDDNSIEELCDWIIDNGASVMSCSWSASAISFQLSLRMSDALHRAATAGRGGKGCVILFAAANSNRPVNGTVNESGWPNNALSGQTRWLNGFATHPDVIAVAACTSLARKSAYSNWGREVSICAPSNEAPPDTYPRVTTPLAGRGVVTTDRVGPSGYSTTDYTRQFGGTSSACPTAAGVAALVISANTSLTAKEVKDILQTTADKITDGNADPQLGLSLGNYDANGHSQWFGYGKVNAFRAVTEAIRRKSVPGNQVVKKTSTPNATIPDNNPAGFRDTINLTDAGTVASVKVRVDISHTYIGDLRLTLIPPSGTPVVLHDRQGGNTKNLRRTFDIALIPALSTLSGQPIKGNWILHVQDLAAIDSGQLALWELEFLAQTNSVVSLEESPGTRIPDNQPAGIQRAFNVSQSGQVMDVEVAVDITHTYIGDLTVDLFAPSGKKASLHNRAGGDADNLIVTYKPASTTDLQSFRGESLQGVWKLEVADREALDSGKLNHWSLRISHS